ncbi:MAG TPA: peptidoglycan editing factor PgeF [Bacteroidota bacterium]|nr:peptidoglycan editing factor PgeF [Bacteroidota bacterium]
MTVIRPAVFPEGVIAGFSTRNGGVSPAPLGMNLSFRVGDDPGNVRRNREIFFGALGISTGSLAIPGQVHGTAVLNVDRPGEYPGTDALITGTPGLFLCVSVADCVPILLFDPLRNAVAAVHAGWRGSAAGIVTAAVQAMETEFGTIPASIIASIGPSASQCCYKVGEEVASQFPPACVRMVEGVPYVDLKGANRGQLLAAGLRAENIELSPYCTISEPALLHSFRRDGQKSGRMMGVIGRMA